MHNNKVFGRFMYRFRADITCHQGGNGRKNNIAFAINTDFAKHFGGRLVPFVMRYIKKYGLFTALLVFLILCFTFPALAEENGKSELYKRQYENSGVSEIESSLPKEVASLLGDIGFDLSNPEIIFKADGERIISLFTDFFTEGIKAPVKTTLSIIGILLIFASFDGIAEKIPSAEMGIFACFVASLVATAPIYTVMDVVKTAIQSLSTFMLSFVPIYAGIMLSSGNSAAAGGFSTILLMAAEAISYLISYFFVPISGVVLCLGICGGISPVAGISRLSEWIKKTANWAMGISTTVFLGILSLQNTFLAASDGLAIRTSKVMLSTTIPIMGPAIAETITTARGCLNLLRSGAGIYAVAAIIIVALPVIIQLFLWRISMWITAGVAEIFGMMPVEKLLRSVDFCLSVLFSSVFFTVILFIISLAVGAG